MPRCHAILFLVALLPEPVRAAGASPPPFVGCPADGMSGPVPAPATPPAAPRVPVAAAAVLAPRGWHCMGMYGSGGSILLVTPRSYPAGTLPGFNSLRGPALELMFLNGENSGRLEVAAVFSRLFPFERRFIREVEDGGRHLPRGPYASDITTRRGRSEVDYASPARREGMGTFGSRLAPGDSPVTGMATLARSNGVDSVVLLNLRLPPGLRALVPVILGAARATWAGHAG